MVLAVIAQKGGVGKTVTAINLGAALAERGHRVLVVDLDSQASASFALGVERQNLHPSTADILLEGLDPASAARDTATDGLQVIPGSPELANFDLRVAGESGRTRRLSKALTGPRKRYDYVILDTPPSLSLVTVNALVACDQYLVPVTPQYLSLQGLRNLIDAIDSIEDRLGVHPQRLGFLLTQVDRRTRESEEYSADLRSIFGDDVLQTEIPVNVRVSEASSHGVPVLEFASSASGSKAYRALAEEVERRAGDQA